MAERDQDNHKLILSVATGRSLAECVLRKINWGKLCEKLSNPMKDNISLEKYLSLKPGQKAKRKASPGWYAGGRFNNGRRSIPNAGKRSLINLDIDDISPEYWHELTKRAPFSEYEWFAHSTRSHSAESPRLRVLIPCAPYIPPELYEAVARLVAAQFSKKPGIALDAIDEASYRVAQMMYLPSISRGQEYITLHNKGSLFDFRVLLKNFPENHRDHSKLPHSPKRSLQPPRQFSGTKQHLGTKPGIVGAFCQIYDVPAVMEKHLEGIYIPAHSEGENQRYTYAGSSTHAGAIVYDNGQTLFSWHATDPAHDRLRNAFDLVRIHRFGHLDPQDVPIVNLKYLPSYGAMVASILGEDGNGGEPAVLEAYRTSRGWKV